MFRWGLLVPGTGWQVLPPFIRGKSHGEIILSDSQLRARGAEELGTLLTSSRDDSRAPAQICHALAVSPYTAEAV